MTEWCCKCIHRTSEDLRPMSPVSVLQPSSSWPCQGTQISLQMWGVRTSIRTSLIVSWSWGRAWTTTRRTWPARGEWQPCAGDNNCLSVGEGCERRAASVCARGTSQRGVGFVFTFHSVITERKDRNSKFSLKYKLCSASAAKFVFPNYIIVELNINRCCIQ